MRDKSYLPKPARREYIAKKNSNKKRPLGIQSGNDKLVQEVVKMILESIYEPVFKKTSHGFRPNKSCQTAFSPEFMNRLPPEEQKAYFTRALDFIAERVGKGNILSAIVHMDEKTPYMHLCFVPVTPEGKLSAKYFLGNQKKLSEWQTAYHERMSSRWKELERGQSSMITGRKHIPSWLFKLGGQLDKQYEEIVKALSDINVFNVGKKRDKALTLLSAWLPEAERFSREIGKQSAYIDSLKEKIDRQEDYAGRLQEAKYEEEQKVRKANQRIFELQRTNRKV